MKGNDGTGNTVDRDEWRTPQWLFDKLNKLYRFTFDCCASASNTKCHRWASDFENIPKLGPLEKVAWMNPPFSIAERMFRHFFYVVDKGVAIYRCDNPETAIWQDLIFPNASWVFYLKGRLNYEGFSGGSPRFASALIGYGNLPLPIGIPGIGMVWKSGQA